MAQIEQLEIKNYKVLADVALGRPYRPSNPQRTSLPEIKLGSFSIFLGPNGCGKSTLFDVFGFLAQCLQTNVSDALAQRGGFHEVRSREQNGPIVFVIKYRDQPNDPLMTYELQIDEQDGRPIVIKEELQWRRGRTGTPFKFLDFEDGSGSAVTGTEETYDRRTEQAVDRADIL